jgi:hypothetical protein
MDRMAVRAAVDMSQHAPRLDPQSSAPAPAVPRTSRRVGRSALALWALLVLVVSVSLASAHQLTLPRPATSSSQLARALAAAGPGAMRGRWSTTHVLYAQCQCSQRIMTHLLRRGAQRDLFERVLLIDAGLQGAAPPFAAAASSRGYALELLTPRALEARFGIVAAPLLIVSDGRDEIRYLGGYTERKQGLDIRDQAIVAGLRRGDSSAELPLFGCAVSRSLQELLDPLGLRYAR